MTQPPDPRRRALTLLVVLLLLACGSGAAVWWYVQFGQWRESTDNAYLTGNLVVVSALVNGTVVALNAEENDQVARGAELLRIGDGDLRQELELRKEELALAVQDVVALRAEVARAGSEVALRETTERLAREEYARRERLFARRMLSEEELDAARTRAEEAAGSLQTARHALEEARVRAGTGSVAEHPAINAAAARLRASYRNWRKTVVVSPVDGQVARRRVQLGQRVEAGTALFSIAERGSAWVEANFKEDQLRHMRPGQPVAIRSDLYGDELDLRGRLASIGAGTGSVFAILPPQNATGNWIKIVQRVPVRIELEERGLGNGHPLPFGASLHVEVDTHRRDGPRLAPTPVRPASDASAVYAYQSEGVDGLITGIIRANGG